MFKSTGLKSFVLLISFCFMLLPMGVQAQDKLFISLGFEYQRGDYGGAESVSSYAIPLALSWFPTERLDLSLTIPYLYQDRGTSVIIGNHRFSLPSASQISLQPPGGGSGGPDPEIRDTARSRSGLGDMTLETGYSLLLESDDRPLIRLILFGKLPTGDEDEGLGTGAFDFGVGSGLGKWFGNWSFYVEGMYLLPGSSKTYKPDNYWTLLAAVDRLLGDQVLAGVSLSSATAVFSGEDDIIEISGNISWLFSNRVSVRGYISKGLTDASADIGAGVSAGISF